MQREKITSDFIEQICALYGDEYNDSIEDSSLGGSDWAPGKTANHKSLRRFKEELDEAGVHLSTGKIRKILITGGCYSTQLSREVGRELERYSSLPEKERIRKVSEVLDISPKTVNMYSPYSRQVYNEEPSENARVIKTWREKKKKFKPGQKVEVTSGILKGYEGTVIGIRKGGNVEIEVKIEGRLMKVLVEEKMCRLLPATL